MAFTYTRVIFGILYLYVMASHHLIHQVATHQCGTSFSVNHAMVCPFGGFPRIRHNEVRDLTASLDLLTEVCHNVATEPSAASHFRDFFSCICNTINDAHLDVNTRGLWRRGQDAYFDVRVFYPNASSYHSLSLTSVYKCHEDAKSKNTAIELETLSMESSLHWSLLLLVAWDVKPLHFTGI